MLILGSDILANRYGYDPVFGNNSWAKIKEVCQAGAVPASWADATKTFVGTDGNTYTIRLSDKQAGRYTYADGSGRVTHAAFELLEITAQTLKWNSTQTNVGGYADSLIRKNLNNYAGATESTTIIDLLPDDLKNLLEEVLVSSSTGGNTYTGQTTSANKLFLLAQGEVTNTSSTPQYQDETVNNGTAFGRYDYYVAHTSEPSHKKNTVGTTSGNNWWLRSTGAGNTNFISAVGTYGSISALYASSSNGVSFAWAW